MYPPPYTHPHVFPERALIPLAFRMRRGCYNMTSDSESCAKGFDLVYVDIFFLKMLGSSATQAYK